MTNIILNLIKYTFYNHFYLHCIKRSWIFTANLTFVIYCNAYLPGKGWGREGVSGVGWWERERQLHIFLYCLTVCLTTTMVYNVFHGRETQPWKFINEMNMNYKKIKFKKTVKFCFCFRRFDVKWRNHFRKMKWQVLPVYGKPFNYSFWNP